MFSIVLLVLLAGSWIAGIASNSMGPQHLDRLYRAAVDIAMTCYGDPGDAIGIIGDADGSILEELRSNHFIPVVLVNEASNDNWDTARSHKLQVFVIAVDSLQNLCDLLVRLEDYIWWNYDASFLIVDTRPDLTKQCSLVDIFMFVTTRLGLLNVQSLCWSGEESILIWNSNPFMRRAPEVWNFVKEYRMDTRKNRPSSFLFSRLYREGGRSCESINFAKTGNVAGYPMSFMTHLSPATFNREAFSSKMARAKLQGSKKLFITTTFNEKRWMIDNIVNAMNVSEVISRVRLDRLDPGMYLQSHPLSTQPELLQSHVDLLIIRLDQWPIFAVTQHTHHKTQLNKVLSVIDRESRFGMWVVYSITFLFFKFFLGQPVMPALLNLVRLTCNTGLTTLPRNVAPTLYLTSLFMFVVTLQAIYTGNLATLLTTVIPHPNVQTRRDIPKLGYTLYNSKDSVTKLTADPILAKCVVELPELWNCSQYVLRDPLAVCALDYIGTIRDASRWKLHVSREPISHDYLYYLSTDPNIFKGRIDEILRTLFEAGLSQSNPVFERLRLQLVDDDEVKKNKVRRIMTFDDLRFAFVILGVGLLCSLVCFIGEIVICWIRLKSAKRRDRVRVLSASGATAKNSSWFPSLNCRFKLRHLFSNRR